MSEHYDTTQKCPKCGLHHDTDDEWCDGLAASPCSVHVLIKVRWSISGFCSTEPVAAFTTRKLANAEARRKNEAATTCEYVVKTLKIIR